MTRRAVLALATTAAMAAFAPAWADMSTDDPATPPEKVEDLKPGERPPPSSDEAGIWLIATEAERKIRTSGTVVRDPAVNAYVRGVACKLAGPYCGDIRVYVVRHSGLNASMSPNGAMVVWTGLILRAANEAQLASVLGHEIGHYIRRHGVQRYRDLRDASGANMILGAVLGAAGIPAGPLVTIALIGSLYSYSRDNEREADALGAKLMAAAGYDVREAAAIWRNVIDERRKRTTRTKRTDPRSSQRIPTLANASNRRVRWPSSSIRPHPSSVRRNCAPSSRRIG